MKTIEEKYIEALDKAKRYDEVFNAAKEWYNNPNSSSIGKSYLYAVFPELKESEDERIRKGLIKAFGSIGKKEWGGVNVKNAIAWLEKQGEQKLYGQRQECVDCQFNYAGECKGSCQMKRDEQNPIDKVEPKFHEGEWIISNDKKSTYQVIEVKRGIYVIRDNADNHEYHIGIEECEKSGMLWNISDAKDGDVLNSPSNRLIWIYKDNEHYHACVNMNYVTDNVATDDLLSIPNDVCPATKDEQTILFARMKEAGYVWDANKKESKKIVAPKFGVGDTMRTLQEASSGITSGLPVVVSIDNEYYHCNNELIAIKDQNNYEYPPMNKKHNAWSEEDAKHLNDIIEFGAHDRLTPNDITWLKSLKDRHFWKPSDEQMDALQYVCRNLNPPLSDKLGWDSLKTLELLYKILKKLY